MPRDQPGIVLQHQRKIGQRPDHQEVDLFAGIGRLPERGGEEADRVGAGDRRGADGTRRAAEPVRAMDMTWHR